MTVQVDNQPFILKDLNKLNVSQQIGEENKNILYFLYLKSITTKRVPDSGLFSL